MTISNFLEKIFYLVSNLHFRDIIDIILLTGIIFLIILIILKAKSFKLILGITILIILYLISNWFNLILTKTLIQKLLPLSFIILALIFQKEIKLFLEQFVAVIPKKKITKNKKEKAAESIITAIRYFSQQKIGAIIVLERLNNLDSLIEGGKLLNSEISTELLISIFSKNSPLHDGAVIIKDDRIKYSSAHLPLADNYQFNLKTGTRHRAGIGITQFSDATSIIVSEETGEVSIAKNNKITYSVSENEILTELKNYYQINSKSKKFFIDNLKAFSQYIIVFILSLLISFSFWVLTNYNKFKVQKIIEVPIEFRNLKEDLALIDPLIDKVKISLSGYDFDLKALDPTKIKLVIDLNDAEEGKYTINISANNLSNIPQNIEVIQLNPKIIKFKIIKKESEQKRK